MQVIEQPVDFKSLSPDIIETSTGRQIKQASAVRWVYQPFKDIKLWDNLNPAVMNSLTLADRPVQILRRCQPYPLTNCEYRVNRHEARRYDHFSNEIPENDLSDNYAGPTPQNPRTGQIVESKFAYSAARELSEMYAKEYGLVVIEPLTGNEDSNVVRQIFEMVQPITYRLKTLEYELNEGAKERIKRSTYPKEVKVLAEKCLPFLQKGCIAAIANAKNHNADFASQIQKATAGLKGNRAAPAEYDEFIAGQLDIEVPRVVQTKSKTNTSEMLLEKLAERELAKGGENDPLLAALAEERAARIALEERLAKIEKAA